MNTAKETRSAWIKMRVPPAEKRLIESKAAEQEQTVTDFLRQRALDYRLRKTPAEKELLFRIARISSNLNQLARWANTHKSAMQAVAVIAHLISLERAVTSGRGKDSSCT